MLRPGNRVAVVAPAGIYAQERLERGLDQLRDWGLVPVPAPNLGQRHLFNAGTAAQRAADLRQALVEPGIDAVWFARGGYGTVHLLDEVPYERLDGRPVVGFSDATALFTALAGRGRAVHGPVLTSLGTLADEDTIEATRALLMEGRPSDLPGEPFVGPDRVVRGPLTGGNIAVLASLCGTPWAWRAAGRIAILEDVGEAPYRLDRALYQLIRAGALEGVRGIALGELSGCAAPPDAGWTLEEVLAERLAPLGVPVLRGLPVGHERRNRPWVLGMEAELGPGGVRVVQR